MKTTTMIWTVLRHLFHEIYHKYHNHGELILHVTKQVKMDTVMATIIVTMVTYIQHQYLISPTFYHHRSQSFDNFGEPL